MLAVKTPRFWARPAIFAVLWILAAALTLSELATIAPALESSNAPPQGTHTSTRRSVGARSQLTSRFATVP
jgi:hypothetical protein